MSRRARSRIRMVGQVFVLSAALVVGVSAETGAPVANTGPGPMEWVDDLTPIGPGDWSYDRAAHLLERAGFGGTPEEIQRLASMTPQQAVDHLVDYEKLDNGFLPEFKESGVYYRGYPSSHFNISFMDMLEYGDGAGVKVLPRDSGPLYMQLAYNELMYIQWADLYETQRLAQWWAERMLRSTRPLEEKLAYFWHGHFATSNDKMRRYDLMKLHYETLRDNGSGNFKDLLIAVSQDPQMLNWLDNRVNTAVHANENFAREIMELFTMGVGNYAEDDIREMARAFTGWTIDPKALVGRTEAARRDLVEAAKLVIDPSIHDDGEKTFLNETGNFDGYDAIDVILKQPATAKFISWKLYRFFSNHDVPEELNLALAQRFRSGNYEIKPLLKTIFLSKDFYSPACFANQIKSPVELVVSTYRKLGLDAIPGVPNFRETTAALGQELLYPPNVAGWEGGTDWINPATLLNRGNFARTVLFPEEAEPPARPFPIKVGLTEVDAYVETPTGGVIPAFYILGESDEDFDTRMTEIMEAKRQELLDRGGSLGDTAGRNNRFANPDETYNNDQAVAVGLIMKARARVKPTGRAFADVHLGAMARYAGVRTVEDAVDYFVKRFLRVALDDASRAELVGWTRDVVGSSEGWTREVMASSEIDYEIPQTERVLRRLVHMIMSLPEYQLG